MADDSRDTFATTGAAQTPALAETVDARGAGERPARKRIGRYEILRRLGSGGMGEVWEASDPDLDRGVAIKVLRGAGGLQMSDRLRREAQALARLAHPNVVAVYDVGVDDGEVYIVMQLVVGVTLDLALAARKHAPHEIVELVARAGRGLVAAHAAGIVHRDFKPTNVLVGADGSVRVSDFGLSRPSEETGVSESGNFRGDLAASITSGKLVGTPAYMAPEQFRRGPLTAATDQFAFCVTLWEALCGERPYAGKDLDSVRDAVIAGRRRELPATTRVSRRVRAVLERGLSPEPGDRFPSMSALLDALTPRRTGVKLAVGGGFAALTAGAVIALSLVSARRPVDPCAGVAAPADAVWNAAREATLLQGLGAHDRAQAQATIELLAERTKRWRAASLDACEATHVRETQSAEVLEQRNRCLARSLADERARIDQLSGPIDNELAERAIDVARGGTDPAQCSRTGESTNAPLGIDPSSALYKSVAAAEAKLEAGRYRDVLDKRAELDPQISAAADPTLEYRWNHVLGAAYASLSEPAEAKVMTRRAAEAATTIGADEKAAYEWSSLADLTAKSSDVSGADNVLAMARAAAKRTGDVDTVMAIEITRGTIASKRGSYADAIVICRNALDTLTRNGRVENRIAYDAWDCIEHAQEATLKTVDAVASARHMVELATRLYGPKHPITLHASSLLPNALQQNGDAAAATPLFERALADYIEVYGAESASVVDLLRERAAALTPAGAESVPEALVDIKRAVAIGDKALEPKDARRALLFETLAYVERALHHVDASNAAYASAIAAYEKLDDPMALARVLYDATDFMRQASRCDLAIPILKRAAKVAADTGQKTRIEAASNAALGACLGAAKKWAEAETVLRAAIATQDALGDYLFGAQTRWELADELGKRGQHAEALKIAHEAADQLVGKPPPATDLRKQILEWKY